MDLYTAHVPDDASDMVTRADRTVLVREGFSVAAFLFGPLFLLVHRAWAALALWIVIAGLLIALLALLHLPPPFFGVVSLLVAVGLGLEGNTLRRWALSRRGYSLADVVSGADRGEAELAFFSKQPASMAPSRAASTWMPQAPPAVIGMFPDSAI